MFRLLSLLTLLALATGCTCSLMPERAPLDFQRQDPRGTFSHIELQRVWNGCVAPRTGIVNTERLRTEFRPTLESYLLHLAQAEPDRWSREEQTAFWIDAHHAAQLRAMQLGVSRDDCTIDVAGRRVSATTIRTAILPTVAEDPASLLLLAKRDGLPSFPPAPSQGSNLRAQTGERLAALVANEEFVRIDRERRVVLLPPAIAALRERYTGTANPSATSDRALLDSLAPLREELRRCAVLGYRIETTP